MAENIPIPIANGYYVSDSPVVSNQQCINMYPNIVQAPALSQETLFGTAGVTQITTTGTIAQQNRGSHKMGDIPYFVNGTSLYRVDRASTNPDVFTNTALGTIEGTGRVSMATNGTQLFILVPGGKGSVWVQSTTTFTPDVNAVDSNFTASGAPQYVDFSDGYFVFTTATKRAIISNLNNGLAYTATDFFTAETDPDKIVGLVVYQNNVYILGSETIEEFENVPSGANQPYLRTGLVIEKGLFAPFSVIKGDGAFRFVGGGRDESPSIYEFQGSGVQKISTSAIDVVLDDMTDAEVAGIFAVHYGTNGQFFTAFTLPAKNETFEFSALSSRWHQRRSFISDALDSWRVSSIETAYGELLCSDRIDGRIGILDEDVYTEYGAVIPRILDTMPVSANGNSFSIASMELTVESGVGNAAVPDPKVRMSRSLDGKTFGDERDRSIGKVGEFHRRVIWTRIGRARRFEIFRFELTDAVKPVFIKLEARIRKNMI